MPRMKHCSACTTPSMCDRSKVCQINNKELQEVSKQKYPEAVNHPPHYGGADNPYEVIKVLYAWGLDKSFNLGNAVKYIARHGKKLDAIEDLKKARWYLDEHIKRLEQGL